jgi:hypothetical protein
VVAPSQVIKDPSRQSPQRRVITHFTKVGDVVYQPPWWLAIKQSLGASTCRVCECECP